MSIVDFAEYFASLLALIGGVVAVIRTKQTAKASGENTVAEMYGSALKNLQEWSGRQDDRIKALEKDLSTEQRHSAGQDDEIQNLRGEVQQLRQQVTSLKERLRLWHAREIMLRANWSTVRAEDEPPESPEPLQEVE